jgi:hypothetical protein
MKEIPNVLYTKASLELEQQVLAELEVPDPEQDENSKRDDRGTTDRDSR